MDRLTVEMEVMSKIVVCTLFTNTPMFTLRSEVDVPTIRNPSSLFISFGPSRHCSRRTQNFRAKIIRYQKLFRPFVVLTKIFA